MITAVVSAVCTAAVAEPIKRWLEGRRLRRSVYQELVHNSAALRRQVAIAEHDPTMTPGIGQRFAMSYRRLAYDLGQKDPAAFYCLGWNELYWIELLYRSFEQVANGTFEDDAQRLRNADFTARRIVGCLKNRNLSPRLTLKVSPKVEREHFREELPKAAYFDIQPPGRAERIRRIWDRFQSWWWRRNSSAPSVWLPVPAIISRAAALEQRAATFGGDASEMAKEDAAQNVDDFRSHAFHSAVHDYLLHKGNDEWRRLTRQEWVAWPDSRLLDVRPAAAQADGNGGRGAG